MLNILGVDVGGTFVRMGTLKDGKVENLVKRSSAEIFSAPGGAAAGLANALKEYAGDTQFAAVGVGIPGTVSRDGERVLNVPNIPGLNDTPLRDALTDALNCPVFVENDITMLTTGDSIRLGLERGVVFGCYIGTGLGGAVLVDGKLLPESYGANAVSRGSNSKRFISTGNNSWETKKITVSIGEETGIDTAEPIAVNIHHPYEKHLGIFRVGNEVEIELMPFRATLVEIAAVSEAEPMLKDCEYEIIREDKDGNPVEVRHLTAETKEKAPVFIGSLDNSERNPADGEFLYETAMYAIGNDSLESRSLRRSGETQIPQVKAALFLRPYC